MKRSVLEKALKKFGVLDSDSLTLQQFSDVLEAMQEGIDISSLDTTLLDNLSDDLEEDSAASTTIESSSRSKVMSLADNPKSEEDDDALELDDFESIGVDDDSDSHNGSDFTPEDAAREVFAELAGEASTISLGDFLRWEELQEMLESEALSKDDLALAIEQADINIDEANDSKLGFQEVNRYCYFIIVQIMVICYHIMIVLRFTSINR